MATYPPERQPFRDMIDGFPVSMRMRDETPVLMLLDAHRKRPEVPVTFYVSTIVPSSGEFTIEDRRGYGKTKGK